MAVIEEQCLTCPRRAHAHTKQQGEGKGLKIEHGVTESLLTQIYNTEPSSHEI